MGWSRLLSFSSFRSHRFALRTGPKQSIRETPWNNLRGFWRASYGVPLVYRFFRRLRRSIFLGPLRIAPCLSFLCQIIANNIRWREPGAWMGRRFSRLGDEEARRVTGVAVMSLITSAAWAATLVRTRSADAPARKTRADIFPTGAS